MEDLGFGGAEERKHQPLELDSFPARRRIRAGEGHDALELAVGNRLGGAVVVPEFLVRDQRELPAEELGVETEGFAGGSGEADVDHR